MEEVQLTEQQKLLLTFAKTLQSTISNNYVVAQKKNLFSKKFNQETVEQYLSNPQKYEKQLRQLSIVLTTLSPLYGSIVSYFSSIAKFVPVVVPNVTKFVTKDGEIDYEKLKKEYLKVSSYMENLSIEGEFTRILAVNGVEDVFYGYQISTNNSNYFLQLDADYCRISSISDGCYNFQFDFSYFNVNNKLKDVDQELLDSYPSEFREKYNKYKTGTSPQWQELDEKNTICIKYTDLPFVFPPWASLYSDLSDLQSYKDTAKAKDANSAYKLLGLQIPLNDKSEKEDALKVSTTTALSFFDMINSSLPEGVGAFLSPMDFEKIDFATNEASEKNKILDAETSLFLSTGISPINFGRANTSTGLNASNLVDSGKLFNLYRKFERWLNRKMKFEFNGKFSIQLLDVTTFTVKEEITQYQSLAQYGVPCKLQLAALCGITAIRERGMSAIEEALDIANTWKPLNSSFTTSNTTDSTEDVGRPKSEDSELSDSGEKSRDTDNGGR